MCSRRRVWMARRRRLRLVLRLRRMLRMGRGGVEMSGLRRSSRLRLRRYDWRQEGITWGFGVYSGELILFQIVVSTKRAREEMKWALAGLITWFSHLRINPTKIFTKNLVLGLLSALVCRHWRSFSHPKPCTWSRSIALGIRMDVYLQRCNWKYADERSLN
jgi:hypothetical protein